MLTPKFKKIFGSLKLKILEKICGTNEDILKIIFSYTTVVPNEIINNKIKSNQNDILYRTNTKLAPFIVTGQHNTYMGLRHLKNVLC